MSGYTRQSESGIIDGGVISASDFNSEFDALACAMSTSGHTHDGTSGEGPKITTAGIASNAVTTDKINTAAVTGAKIDSSTTITAACFCGNVVGNATGITNVTSTTAELNCLDGLTATTAELNYVDGVTSSIQTQLDGKLTNVCEDTSPELGGTLTACFNMICDAERFHSESQNGCNEAILGVNNFYNNSYVCLKSHTTGYMFVPQSLNISVSAGHLYNTPGICVCSLPGNYGGLGTQCSCVTLYSNGDAKLCTTTCGVSAGCINVGCLTFNGGGGLKFAGGCKLDDYIEGNQLPGLTFTGLDETGNTLTIGSNSCICYTTIGNLTHIHGYIETSCVALCCSYTAALQMCNVPGGISGNTCVKTQYYNNICGQNWCSNTCQPDVAYISAGSGIFFLKPDGTTLKACDLTCHSSGTNNKIHFNFTL